MQNKTAVVNSTEHDISWDPGLLCCGFGKGAFKAFESTEAVDETKQDLSMYGGYIARSTWDVDPLVEWG